MAYQRCKLQLRVLQLHLKTKINRDSLQFHTNSLHDLIQELTDSSLVSGVVVRMPGFSIDCMFVCSTTPSPSADGVSSTPLQ